MARTCVICGRRLRTGIKYCYACKNPGLKQQEYNTDEDYSFVLFLFVAIILIAGIYYTYIAVKWAFVTFGYTFLFLLFVYGMVTLFRRNKSRALILGGGIILVAVVTEIMDKLVSSPFIVILKALDFVFTIGVIFYGAYALYGVIVGKIRQYKHMKER